MKLPGPDHPITVKPQAGTVRVRFGGQVLAETTHALLLQESTYPAVLYIPRADVRMDLFQPTSNASHCPYKGDASYFSAVVDGKRSENAAWSYEKPFDHMTVIKDHLAFYPNRVDAIEVAA